MRHTASAASLLCGSRNGREWHAPRVAGQQGGLDCPVVDGGRGLAGEENTLTKGGSVGRAITGLAGDMGVRIAACGPGVGQPACQLIARDIRDAAAEHAAQRSPVPFRR